MTNKTSKLISISNRYGMEIFGWMKYKGLWNTGYYYLVAYKNHS